MIKVNKLSFSYDKKKKFIKDLSFNIEKGKITTILGPNGSGKSTVLSLLCGLNKISSGEIIINDKDIKSMKYKDIAKLLKIKEGTVKSRLSRAKQKLYEILKED